MNINDIVVIDEKGFHFGELAALAGEMFKYPSQDFYVQNVRLLKNSKIILLHTKSFHQWNKDIDGDKYVIIDDIGVYNGAQAVLNGEKEKLGDLDIQPVFLIDGLWAGKNISVFHYHKWKTYQEEKSKMNDMIVIDNAGVYKQVIKKEEAINYSTREYKFLDIEGD
jgi:hypothetical protein